MGKTPEISVITAVYNGEEYLEQCLESVCTQTFPDFELIVVNDASTDGTEEILHRWQKKDPRIRVLKNESNKGRPLSRNRALTAAQAPFLAILDADDYSVPDRLEKQHAYMLENPEIQILGGDIIIHGTDNVLRHQRTNNEIRADLFFDSSLFHSTVMMRKKILKNTNSWYDPDLPLSQDYGLWASLMFTPEAVFTNLPLPLSHYRMPEKPRPEYQQKQFNYANIVRARIMQQIGLVPDRHNLSCHLALLYGNAAALGVSPADCAAWGKKLSEANAKNPLAAPSALDEQISGRLNRIFTKNILDRKEKGQDSN